VRELAILLENLISIRIGSRDPEQHILVKQCLVGIGSDPFTVNGNLAIVVVTRFSATTVCFFGFGPHS
jgi:hypothetical protein